MKTLVLGIGNDILSDDGIGPKLVRKLEAKMKVPGVKFMSASVGGLDILEIMKDYEDVVVIDAIRTGKGKPGEVYTFTPADFKETLHLSNMHDINFLNALELGKKVGMNTPSEILIIGVEIAEDHVFSSDFSEEISSNLSNIVDKVSSILLRFIGRY